jgi:hypothetical protein
MEGNGVVQDASSPWRFIVNLGSGPMSLKKKMVIDKRETATDYTSQA